jgi:tetratricopeptide (TPR) repeat protein
LRAFLEYLIAHCPAGCHLLFTTRYRIEGLPDAVEMLNLDKLSPAEQYRWLSYSRELRYVPAADRLAIYRRLDGLPRAFQFLEALARNRKDFDWGNLEAELGKVEARVFENLMLGRIYRLLGTSKTLVEQIFEAVLGSELHRGKSEIQITFLVAAVFINRAPFTALAEVSGFELKDVRKFLKKLNNWSICYWDAENDEFEVHPLVRQWITSNSILSKTEMERLALRIAKYYERNFEIENLELEAAYYELANDHEGQWRLTQLLTAYNRRVGRNGKALELQKIALMKFTEKKYQHEILAILGVLYHEFSEYEKALEYSESSLVICRGIRNENAEANVLNNIGSIYRRKLENEKAKHHMELALKIQERIGDVEGASTTLNNIGGLLIEQERFEEALPYLERSLEIHKRLDYPSAKARVLTNLASIVASNGQYHSALTYLEECLIIQQGIVEDPKSRQGILSNMGAIYGELGDVIRARDCIGMSIQICQEIGDLQGLMFGFYHMGYNFCEENNFEEAIPYLMRSWLMSFDLPSSTKDLVVSTLAFVIDNLGSDRFNEIVDLNGGFLNFSGHTWRDERSRQSFLQELYQDIR